MYSFGTTFVLKGKRAATVDVFRPLLVFSKLLLLENSSMMLLMGFEPEWDRTATTTTAQHWGVFRPLKHFFVARLHERSPYFPSWTGITENTERQI